MTDIVRAPWNSEQVQALNDYQERGRREPRICGSDQHKTGRSPLLDATHSGWICPDPACTYTSDWEWRSTVDYAAGIRDAARTAAARQTTGRTPDATVDPTMCPRCKGDNQDAFELCADCTACQTTGQDDTKPVDPTAAIEVWARMLNAADVHVYGPEHSHWRDLSPNIQNQYRKAATWLIPRLTIQALPTPAPAKHRPPCVDGDYCGEAAHCPPLTSTGRDDTEDPEPSAVNPACTNCNGPTVGQPAEAHDTEARPADHSWLVMKRGAGCWLVESIHYRNRDRALTKLDERRQQSPDDEFAVVRETATWTVEDER
ncbi:hypothetical protein ACFVFF_23115 [Streptomyces sp. NPDC057680]|uniref:hypothetical protein n=1 Tax=Streptomyces sp. NPDC057680 TaxID=3346208 RepID=UPI0036AFBB9D